MTSLPPPRNTPFILKFLPDIVIQTSSLMLFWWNSRPDIQALFTPLCVSGVNTELDPTMDASLRPSYLLLLSLLSVSTSRLRIPPHDQVARVARFVAHRCDWASMATTSTQKLVVGQPFSNVFSVSDGPVGSGTGVPYMYLTRMEISVQDLEVKPGV